MIEEIATNYKPIDIGIKNENNARCVIFKDVIADWITSFGNTGTFSGKMITESETEIAIPQADLSFDTTTDTLTWTLTTTETAESGNGLVQLEYSIDTRLVKSCVWGTECADTII